MKKVKMILASALTLSMLLSLTSCSAGYQASKFYDFASDNFDYEEYSVKKYSKLSKSDKKEAREDGILVYIEEDEMEDFFDAGNDDEDSNFGAVKCFLDTDDMDPDDVKEMTYFSTGEEDDKKYDVTNIYVMNFVDKNAAQDAFNEVLDRVEDDLDVDLEELDEAEYKFKGNSGYIVVNIDSDTFCECFLSYYVDMYEDYGEKLDKDQKKELKKAFKDEFGDIQFYMATYLKGDSVVCICGMSNQGDSEEVEDFCEEFKIACPFDVENSDVMNDALIDNFVTDM